MALTEKALRTIGAPLLAALLLLSLAFSSGPAQALDPEDDPLPHPFKVGARWEYDVTVPVAGKIGTAVRYIEPGGVMSIAMDVRDSKKCGVYYYVLLPTEKTLVAVKAGFRPSKDGEPFEIFIDPPFPFFPNPSYAGEILVRNKCRALAPDGTFLGEGWAELRTLGRHVELNGIKGLHQTIISQDFHHGIVEQSTVWMHPEQGIVYARVKLNFFVTVDWSLTKFTPPPK